MAASGGGGWLPRPAWPHGQDRGWERSPQLPTIVPRHQGQASTTVEPSPWDPLSLPEDAVLPPSPVPQLRWELAPALLRLAVPMGCLALLSSFCWPWIPHVPETTDIPHFAKNGKNCLRHLAGWLTGRDMLFWCCPRLCTAEGPQPPCQGCCWLCPRAPLVALAEPTPLLQLGRPRAHLRCRPTGTCIGCKARAEEPTPKKKQ